MKRRFALGLLPALFLGALGCPASREPDPLVERAAFGVFFGGQIQDRSELAFELDPSKQRSGLRVDFRAPLTRPVEVGWEISRPLSARVADSDAGSDRVVEVGHEAARVGETQLDVPLSLRQGQVLGVWHVRVTVEARVVLERDVRVFDPRQRRERDAGR